MYFDIRWSDNGDYEVSTCNNYDPSPPWESHTLQQEGSQIIIDKICFSWHYFLTVILPAL